MAADTKIEWADHTFNPWMFALWFGGWLLLVGGLWSLAHTADAGGVL